MIIRRISFIAAGLLTVGLLAAAQQANVKKVPLRYAPPNNAQQLYTQYCASCHGTDMTGHGPAAEAMKTPPTDLTQLAKKNGGKFDDQMVVDIIRGNMEVKAHGSKEMPVWGPMLGQMYRQDQLAHIAIDNLASYIKAHQKM